MDQVGENPQAFPLVTSAEFLPAFVHHNQVWMQYVLILAYVSSKTGLFPKHFVF